MERHMQNISFLVIIGVLLGCAFFFSEQTRIVENQLNPTPTDLPPAETREDIPDCSEVANDTEKLSCYQKAASISNHLVENLADQILSQEMDSKDRIAFLEMQQAWEDSREVDCAFIQNQAEDEVEAEIASEECLLAHNLVRLDQLETLYCSWIAPSSCNSSTESRP